MLAIGAGWLAALVTTATFALYLFAYTPLKLRTSLCTLVGRRARGAAAGHRLGGRPRRHLRSAPGCCSASCSSGSCRTRWPSRRLYQDDYARAGVRLLPVVDAQGGSTERQIVTGCLALLAVSLLPTLIGLAGAVYFVGALVLGGTFAAFGVQQALAPSASRARRVLLASLLYLPVLLALLAFDKA